MDVIQIAFLPLGVFWVAFKTMLDAAAYTNNMRETIVLGIYSGSKLSFKHRWTMFVDWCFTMFAIITALFIFSGIIFWISRYIAHDPKTVAASPAIFIIASTMFIGAFIFIINGFFDLRLIRSTLHGESRL
jgi:hypothetical protein